MILRSLSVVFDLCICFQNNCSADQQNVTSVDLILMFIPKTDTCILCRALMFTPETDTYTLCHALQCTFACQHQRFAHQCDMNPLVFPLEANHLGIALASSISQLKVRHFRQAWVEKLLSQKEYSQYLYMLHPHLLVYDLNKIYLLSTK